MFGFVWNILFITPLYKNKSHFSTYQTLETEILYLLNKDSKGSDKVGLLARANQ